MNSCIDQIGSLVIPRLLVNNRPGRRAVFKFARQERFKFGREDLSFFRISLADK